MNTATKRAIQEIAADFGLSSAIVEALLDIQLICHVNGRDFARLLARSEEIFQTYVSEQSELLKYFRVEKPDVDVD